MIHTLIIIAAIGILVLILYLVNFKFEFRYNKNTGDSNDELEKQKLDKLSNTELNILRIISDGRSNQEIADELFISIHTVKKHVSNIFKKLHLTSRSEARKYKSLIN